MNPYEPILSELATGLLDTSEVKQNFSNNAFLDSIIIFETVFMDKLYDCQNYDNKNLDDRLKMVDSAAKDLVKLIHTYTGLDTIKLVNNYELNK
jgi:hypothetical protein